VTGEEWNTLAAGLEQRLRALNAFVCDAYGERGIVQEGVMPADVIDGAEGFEPDLRGALPGGVAPIGVAGFDLVRDSDGVVRVLEDNARTPSGFTYAVAARLAVQAELPPSIPQPAELHDPLREALLGCLRDAAPEGADDPYVVVLSDGPGGSAWYEHAQAARLIGAPVATLEDLERVGDRLFVRLDDGSRRLVDVVYRRCDDDRLRDQHGALTPVAEALLEPWRGGRIAVVNAFGTGVADDKLVHAYVEEMVRFYLGEEPVLPNVPTHELGRPDVLQRVLADLEHHVVKPRMGHGGEGVLICAHADPRQLARLRDTLSRSPERFVAQPTIALSLHPTVIGRALEPRHVDLRPFAFATSAGACALPGGLTRVAWDPGALVVNSSQNGGAKDTWVVA
jgi:uncharacterized circularly permuted ATP-grasp superfamily protein